MARRCESDAAVLNVVLPAADRDVFFLLFHGSMRRLVQAALSQDPATSHFHLEVTAKDSSVLLMGEILFGGRRKLPGSMGKVG